MKKVFPKKEYGKLPPEVWQHLPGLFDLLKRHHISPYVFIGEWFGVSPSRAQQVVLAERRKAKEEADS